MLDSRLAGRAVRPTAVYDLVSFAHLPVHAAARFAALREHNPELAFVLVPRDPRLSWKAVDAETGGMWERSRVGASGMDVPVAARLVLDRVFEVESETGFVSGPTALDTVFASLPEPDRESTIGSLSFAALLCAQERDAAEPTVLADRLYRFHRLPRSPKWLGALPDAEAVAARLGLDRRSRHADVPHAAYERGGDDAHWTHWHPRGASAGEGPILFKLYVSPALHRLRQSLAAALRLFDSSDAPRSVKVGRTASGLLRPDRLVMHFDSWDALARAATTLEHDLADVEAHGVPFTAQWNTSGVLSWGVDPPQRARLPGWTVTDASWRSWLTQRLAAALITGRVGEAAGVPPWRFALARVALDGIDVQRWTLDRGTWTDAK